MKARGAIRHGILSASALLIAAPFCWMVWISLLAPGEATRGSFSLDPSHFAMLQNYATALTKTPLPRFLLNGLIVCAATIILQIAIAAPFAFALAKLEVRRKGFWLTLVIIGLLIPREVVAVPMFFLCYGLRILDTYVALILPGIISPLAVFLLYQVFRTVPDDLIHAARVDGLNAWAILWHVMLPLARPTLVAVAIISVVTRWNDLFWPGIAVTSLDLMPPPLGIIAFRDEEAGTDYGPLMAAAVVVVAPLVLGFLIAQRRFIDSFSAAGATK